MGLGLAGCKWAICEQAVNRLPWAGPPPFDQVKWAGLFTGMGLYWAVPRVDVS